MALDDILLEAEDKMEKTYNKTHEDFGSVRTGKASPALVENIRVETYGSNMRLKEIASVTIPEPRLIVIQPWDMGNVEPIRKAIEESKIGISPLIDGKIIRIPIPELSEERRKDLVKVLRKMSEDGRVAIRHARREAIDSIKKAQKDGDITEDDQKNGEKEIQNLTDQYTGKIDKDLETKEVEIMKV